MKFLLTVIMCSVIDGQTTCIPPFTFDTRYNDAYDCMIEGYNKSSEKILELGREDVNEYNIFIKFGCTPVAAKATAI
tara:strand:- start:186 stop:416 length:231 start_codon:yes stop_codon:yes gene_type:complete